MANTNLKPIIESYNIDEEFLYNKTYLFIKGYAVGRNLTYTLKALPLARKVHNGQYRHGTMLVENPIGDGTKIERKIPYILHVLKVCSTLISLNLPMTNEELDILTCAALLHDVIEDAEDGFFKNDGYELVTEYGFPKEIYTIVKLLSKRSGSTKEELNVYFNEIKKNKFALLIKMADRSHNVEDLYTMKLERLHRYVEETRTWIYPLSSYCKANYPELSNGVTILKAKIISLTEATETIVNMYEDVISSKDKEIAELKKQIKK